MTDATLDLSLTLPCWEAARLEIFGDPTADAAVAPKYPNAIIDFWGTEATRDFEIALWGAINRLAHLLGRTFRQKRFTGQTQAISAAATMRKVDAGELV